MKKIINFFASLKLTLFLLFALALTSIIGTIIPQGLNKSQYAKHFSPIVFKIFDTLNLFDMYHSWWFITLLALLIINLIFCSLKHYKVTVKRIYDKNVLLTPDVEKTIILKENFSIPKKKFKLENTEKFIKENLSAEKFTKNVNNGETHFFVNKFKFSNFGYYIVHLSLIIIGIGAIIGGIFGFKGMVNIMEGDTVDKIMLRSMKVYPLDFKIKCIDFEIKFYPDGTPREYKSLVEIIDGEKKFQKEIKVNHPLKYKGITFYQASYGTVGQEVEIKVYDRINNKLILHKFVPLKMPVDLDNNTKFVIMNYSTNFQGFGPAVQIAVINNNMHTHFNTKPFIIFKNFPDFDLKHRDGKYYFQLGEANFKYYTGLQVTKDPGVNLVWIGCFIMTIGFFVTFFLINKKYWIRIREENNKVNITFAGSCRKNRIGFEKEYYDKLEKLKKIFS